MSLVWVLGPLIFDKHGIIAVFLLLQVTICQKCGDKGFSVALIYCDSCQVYAQHRYEQFVVCVRVLV
jgi:hypothetical protein